jgi:hypothetical protein
LLLYRSVLELFSKSFKVFHCSVINVRRCYFQQLVYFIISPSRCQQLFYFFLCCRSFAATLISYHVCRFLSTTFFSAIYSVGAQYHLALSDQNCSARVSFVIIPPSSNFVNQKLQIKLYSDNLCCILKLLYHAFYFSHNTRNSYHIAYA